jgi:ferredoxin-NADP reductase
MQALSEAWGKFRALHAAFLPRRQRMVGNSARANSVRTAGVRPSSQGRLQVSASRSMITMPLAATRRNLALPKAASSMRSLSITKPRADHLDLTAGENREQCLAWATITEILQLTPTAKKLVLRVDGTGQAGDGWSFKAGQWVDFHIPSVDTVGGYSIASIPRELPYMDLVVKASKHPPAAWVCEQALVGDQVQMRVGGEFVAKTVEPRNGSGPRLLFIAGGVGINPLYSILRDTLAAAEDADSTGEGLQKAPRVALIFSAISAEELVFLPELSALAASQPQRLRLFLTCTGQSAESTATQVETHAVSSGRVDSSMIGEAVEWLGGAEPAHDANDNCGGVDAVYVCGPPGMAQGMVEECGVKGIPPSQVHFESWW